MNIGVTTILKPDSRLEKVAQSRADNFHFPYHQREGKLSSMAEKYRMEGFLIYGHQLPVFWTQTGEYRFHLGTAALRIHQLEQGHGDRLCDLIPCGCRSVLDCTFGHGGDSFVLSWHLGEDAQVTALEKSPILYEIGKWGLSFYPDLNPEVVRSLQRIRILHEDFKNYLDRAASKSFDIVYFDTMFKAPVKREENRVEGFRTAACYDSLDKEIIRSAMRVAKKRVIVKERPFSILFRENEFTRIYGKHGQTTAYGVIDV